MSKKDAFDRVVSYPLKRKDLINRTDEDILSDQRQKDLKALAKIQRAERRGIITPEGAEYLRMYFGNGMEAYRQMAVVFLRKKEGPNGEPEGILGEKENFKIVDPVTKKVILDEDEALFKHITPNTCAILKIPFGSNKNSLFFTMPGLKNVDRAIEKISVNGKYKGDYTRLNDVLRVSISGKRLEEVESVYQKILKTPGIKILQVKDKFCANDVTRADEFTEKNFRNKVVVIELPNKLKVEIQLKITALEMIDDLTHGLYEKQRAINEDPNLSDADKKTKTAIIDRTIEMLYRLGIEKYNQKVLKKVFREEEESGSLIMGETPNKEGLFPECIRIIQDNFLARPKKVLSIDEPLFDLTPEIKEQIGYNNLRKELKHLFSDAIPEIKDVYNRYKKYIIPKHLNSLRVSDMQPRHQDNLGSVEQINKAHEAYLISVAKKGKTH